MQDTDRTACPECGHRAGRTRVRCVEKHWTFDFLAGGPGDVIRCEAWDVPMTACLRCGNEFYDLAHAEAEVAAVVRAAPHRFAASACGRELVDL